MRPALVAMAGPVQMLSMDSPARVHWVTQANSVKQVSIQFILRAFNLRFVYFDLIT